MNFLKTVSTKSVIFLGLLFIFVSLILAKPASATIPPTFTFTLVNSNLGAHSDMILSLDVPVGEEVPHQVDFNIPAGWTVTPGNLLADNTVVATGSLRGFSTQFGIPVNISFNVTNVADLSKTSNCAGTPIALWQFNFPVASPPIPYCVEGSSAAGYVVHNSVSNLTSTVGAPMNVTLAIKGDAIDPISAQPVTVIQNPISPGTYNWSVTLGYLSGGTITITTPFLLPGGYNTTTGGSDVILGDKVVVNYSTVTSPGATTLTTTTAPPPQGTGQFQITPGGLYYDFNTSATISCPCTITLPYDPATNPNPRIYHLNSTTGLWEDATTAVDTTAHTVTGVVNSFSFFVVASPNFTVVWQNPVVKLMANKGNPFPIESGEDLGIKFNLHDSGGANATPGNVTVGIWQTTDASGNSITPVKVLSLDPKLNVKKARYQTELDLENAGLLTGATYEIRVVVDSTVVTQTPTAAFKVTADDGHHEASDSHEDSSLED